MKTLIFSLFMFLSNTAAAGELKNMAVTASFASSEEKAYLSFDVTNNSGSDITLYKGDLPWGNIYSTMIVVCLANGKELRRVFPIDDPGPDSLKIKNGQKVDGRLDLSETYPSLTESSKKSDIVVFWSYVMKTIDDKASDRFGGMVVIKKDSIITHSAPNPLH